MPLKGEVVGHALKVMKITLLIMKNHGIVFLNFCGNPVNSLNVNLIVYFIIYFIVYFIVYFIAGCSGSSSISFYYPTTLRDETTPGTSLL